MDKARLEDLIEKGYVTRVLSSEDQGALAAKSEQELVELGYLTHVGFDGADDTVEEEIPVEVEPQPANLEPENQPEDQPEDQPVVPVVEEEEEAGDEPEVEPAVEE